MIDCNKEMTNFYNEKVRLKDLWNTLVKYREANLKRLTNGLTKNSYPQYSNSINQGSYAMSTIIQHPDNDYDIDIGIIFTKDSLKVLKMEIRLHLILEKWYVKPCKIKLLKHHLKY